MFVEEAKGVHKFVDHCSFVLTFVADTDRLAEPSSSPESTKIIHARFLLGNVQVIQNAKMTNFLLIVTHFLNVPLGLGYAL